MQFADGGTMRGNLTVQGIISASGGIRGAGNTEIISKSGLTNYGVIDTFDTSNMLAGKYTITVQLGSYIHFSEVSVTTAGSSAVVIEYGINESSPFPFVEYGAVIDGTTVSLTAQELGGEDMESFTFKGIRLNLY
jgi:hypothetical protein